MNGPADGWRDGAASAAAMAPRLRSLAMLGSAGRFEGADAEPGGFVDEAGHRRPVDGPFVAWRRRGEAAGPSGRGAGRGGGEAAGDGDGDVALWSALVDPGVDVDAALARLRHPLEGRSSSDGGALFPHRGRTPIEVWTEVELSSLHALCWLARERGREDWWSLAWGVARWHVENLQPDNATNHPWAVHVFLWMSAGGGPRAADARLYADTLLHNCMVSQGRPDRLSAEILADAADALESLVV